MHDLYSENDLLQISSQLKKRWFLLGIGLAVILAVFIWSLTARTEWLSVVSFFLFCVLSIFVIEMLCLPLHRYKRLLTSALAGRNHT